MFGPEQNRSCRRAKDLTEIWDAFCILRPEIRLHEKSRARNYEEILSVQVEGSDVATNATILVGTGRAGEEIIAGEEGEQSQAGTDRHKREVRREISMQITPLVLIFWEFSMLLARKSLQSSLNVRLSLFAHALCSLLDSAFLV